MGTKVHFLQKIGEVAALLAHISGKYDKTELKTASAKHKHQNWRGLKRVTMQQNQYQNVLTVLLQNKIIIRVFAEKYVHHFKDL